MAEGQTEKGVNEISAGDKNMDDEFRTKVTVHKNVKPATSRNVVKKKNKKKKSKSKRK